MVKKGKGRIKACYDRQPEPKFKGIVKISFQIEPNGRIRKAEVAKPAKLKNAPVGRCLVQTVKSFRFPKFSGKPIKINYPFILR